MRITSWAVFLGLLAFGTFTGVECAISDDTNDSQNSDTLPGESTSSPPFVSAPAGDFTGHWDDSPSDLQIAAFEGIPYAQPPVGSLRFQVAQPIQSRLTDFTASNPGNMCSQRQLFGTSEEVFGEEDCLYLNVYVPKKYFLKKHELLPVLFCIHGGGFIESEGYPYKTSNLLDKDVVFVTFNYRLGPLGFLTTLDGVIPGNLGLKDQVAALRWVHDNIASFGGNPSIVTVLGHNSGGASAELLMLSPLTRGLVHRAIAMSGSAQASWALAYPGETQNRLRVAAIYLCCPPDPSPSLLKCLRKKTHQEITRVDLFFPGWNELLPRIYFKPVVEGNVSGAFLPYHPREMYSYRLYNDIPFMTGVVSAEANFFTSPIFANESLLEEYNRDFTEVVRLTLPWTETLQHHPGLVAEVAKQKIFGSRYIYKSLEEQASRFYRDFWFIWPMINSISDRAKTASKPAYLYYFGFVGTGSSGKRVVSHGDDLYYLILPLHGFVEPELLKDYQMSRIMTDLVTSFASEGAPKSKLFHNEWQAVASSKNCTFLHIQSPTEIHMRSNLLMVHWGIIKNMNFD